MYRKRTAALRLGDAAFECSAARPAVVPTERSARRRRVPPRLALLVLVLPAVTLTPTYAYGVPLKVLLLLVMSLALIWPTRPVTTPWSMETIGCVVLLIGAGIGLLRGRAPMMAILGWVGPAALVAIHLAAAHGLRRRVRTPMVCAWLVAAAVVAILGLIGFTHFRADGANESLRSSYLSTPLFPHAYIAAQALLPIVPMAAAVLCLGFRRRRALWLSAAALAPIFAFLLLTHSRAIWFGVLAGLVAIAPLSRIASRAEDAGGRAHRSRWLRLGGLVVTGVAGLVVLCFVMTDAGREIGQSAFARVTDLARPNQFATNVSRLLIWNSALRLGMESFPLGIGTGQFVAVFEPQFLGRGYAVHAHNQLVHAFVETGVLGVVGLLLIVVGAFRRGLALLRDPGVRRERVVFVVGALASLVAYVVHAQFECPLLTAPGAAGLGLLTGALCAPTGGTGRAARGVTSFPAAAAGLALIAALTVSALDSVAGFHCWTAQRSLRAGAHEDAVRASRRAVAVSPHLPFTWLTLATASDLAGERDDALHAYANHEARSPGVPLAIYRHAALLALAGRPAEAVPLLERARWRMDARHRPRITLDLATCLLRSGRADEARPLLHGLVRQGHQGGMPLVLRRLAECLIELETERALALKLLHAYELRIDPPDPMVQDLRERALALP